MKRYSVLPICLIFCIILLCGCVTTDTPEDYNTTIPQISDTVTTTETQPPETQPQNADAEILRLIDGETAIYTVIRPEKAGALTISAMVRIRDYFYDITGVYPTITEDWVARNTDPDSVSECEILIGGTNRTADDGFPEVSGWCVAVAGKRIIITADRETNLDAAVGYFISKCVFTEGVLMFNIADCHSEEIENPYFGAEFSLKVGSYNIKTGSDIGYDMSIIADDITKLDLDIVGLQEIDQLTGRVNGLDTMKALSEATGYAYYAFAKGIDLRGGEYGTAVLSRYPITGFTVTPLESGGHEQRSVGHAVIDIYGVPIDFFNTHLSYEEEAVRTKQFKQLATLLGECDEYILTGDFNTQDTAEFSALPDATLVNRNKYATYPSSSKAIDNIVISEGFAFTDSGMSATGHSDHNLLWAEIHYGDNK